MEMKLTIDLLPISTPNFVLQKVLPSARQEGRTESQKFRVDELPVEVLDGLCKEFRADLFKKAGKKDPEASKLVRVTE